ncbi:hypothetical protein [Nocardioides sp.]|uniref:hypothetical protein n=1 Tax=Nocardioides sp. TaxID=35761 RepID=UPI002CD58444|nr:hypothetical protein [Nocardioides sp.]HXH77693.1 hypothetical protein [Nocardioides sp.]
MPLALLLPVLIVLALVCGAIGYSFGRSAALQAPPDAGAINERDVFIEHLRELAWQHRDISPELSTILIDEISQRHRRGPGQLPGSPA